MLGAWSFKPLTNSPLTTHHSPLTTHHSPLTTHHSLTTEDPMGLASALTTALTGMTAAETQIDVVGNNLANSQTVGFKESNSIFATQFLQTHSLGSGPTEGSGGTNPRQTGLGT